MKMRMQGLVALVALGLNFAAIAAEAQDAATGAVDIEASEMEILETDKRAIFRGDVVAKRPTDTIRCQEMIVNYVDVKQADGSASTEVDTLDCKTSVTITTPTQTITGDLAVFQVRKDVLDVTGNVKVVQGKTVLRGPRLNVNLKTKYTKMTGGRVKGRFVPK
jgi:lipopolysaccharide export system protein LptA